MSDAKAARACGGACAKACVGAAGALCRPVGLGIGPLGAECCGGHSIVAGTPDPLEAPCEPFRRGVGTPGARTGALLAQFAKVGGHISGLPQRRGRWTAS